jgi:hypothetical protein
MEPVALDNARYDTHLTHEHVVLWWDNTHGHEHTTRLGDSRVARIRLVHDEPIHDAVIPAGIDLKSSLLKRARHESGGDSIAAGRAAGPGEFWVAAVGVAPARWLERRG